LAYGFGEQKTPLPFVAACDKFIYTEILRAQSVGAVPEPIVNQESGQTLEFMLRTAVTATARDNGWAPLSTVGSMIMKNHSSFDPRNYGCQKLGELVRKQAYLEVKEVPIQDGSSNVHLFVRLKG
jgi:hypothetical protein